MIIQIITLESTLSENEFLAIAKEREPQFRALPGLIQKYYVKLAEPNRYGGLYIWDSEESLGAFRDSGLAASIPKAYKVASPPKIETLDVLFQLRQ